MPEGKILMGSKTKSIFFQDLDIKSGLYAEAIRSYYGVALSVSENCDYYTIKFV